ncbi:hypothetical protein Tco_0597071 [Tanacetum coccineum]
MPSSAYVFGFGSGYSKSRFVSRDTKKLNNIPTNCTNTAYALPIHKLWHGIREDTLNRFKVRDFGIFLEAGTKADTKYDIGPTCLSEDMGVRNDKSDDLIEINIHIINHRSVIPSTHRSGLISALIFPLSAIALCLISAYTLLRKLLVILDLHIPFVRLLTLSHFHRETINYISPILHPSLPTSLILYNHHLLLLSLLPLIILLSVFVNPLSVLLYLPFTRLLPPSADSDLPLLPQKILLSISAYLHYSHPSTSLILSLSATPSSLSTLSLTLTYTISSFYHLLNLAYLRFVFDVGLTPNRYIRDLKQQRDKLDLAVIDYKRQKEEYQKTQMIFNQTQRDKEEKYLNDIIQLQAKNKDLENVVCKMGKSTETLRLLTNEQKAFRDNLRKSGLGYNGPYVLSQAYAKIPKLYRAYELCDKNEQLHVFDSEDTLEDAEKSQLKMNEFQKDEKVQELKIKPIDYTKLNKLYDDFVPQKELSAEQTYFPSSFISFKKELSKRIVELEKDLSKFEAKSIAFEITLQHKSRENNSLKTLQKENENFMASLQIENAHLKQTYKDLFDSVQRSRVETNHCDEVKVKVNFDEIETKNIELEYQVTSLIKENEHLKLTYQSLFDSIKKSRVQTKTSNVTQNEAENLKSQLFEFAETKFNNIFGKIEFFKKKQLDISELNKESGEKQNLFENETSVFQIKIDELEKSLAKQIKENSDLLIKIDNLENVFADEEKRATLGKLNAFDNENCDFESKVIHLEKIIAQKSKDFDDVNLELSNRTAKFKAYFEKLEKKTKDVLERQYSFS